MITRLTRTARTLSALCFGLALLGCTAETNELDLAQTRQAAVSIDETLCSARASTIVTNTGKIIVNSGARVDSYDSNLGAYGAPNVGSQAVLQAATTVLKNGGAVIQGSVIQNAPGGFPAVAAPSSATKLPFGASSPGSLNISGPSSSLLLAPGNYVVKDLNINAPGTIGVIGTGEVRIWVTGNLNLGGSVNSTSIPRNLALIVPTSGWVNFNGGAFRGLLYAPLRDISLGGQIFGTVIGKSVTLNSGAAVHFDVSSTCFDSPDAVVDQSLVTPGGVEAGVYGPGSVMTQSFTAGITGSLIGASIALDASNTTYLARIQVRTIVDGHPSSVVLGEGMATSGGDISINTVIEFATPIAQVAGQQYALVVDYPSAPPFVNGAQPVADWIGNQNPSSYPGGKLAYSNDGGVTWGPPAEFDADLLFQTYVIPD
jgi:hypothetical protein